jgi:hypothetical protein
MILTETACNLWTATQPLRFLGIDIGSRMSVVRLPSGALVIISPIELTEHDCQMLNSLGTVEQIIAPNLFHHFSIGSAQALYPHAQTWGVAGLQEKRPDVTFTHQFSSAGSFENTLDYLPFNGFKTIMPNGIKPANETVFYHRLTRTLIITDIAYNFDRNNTLGTRFAAKVLLGSYETLMPSRFEKLATRHKSQVADSVKQVLNWDFDRVIPGHGSIVETGGKEQFEAGYQWFLR